MVDDSILILVFLFVNRMAAPPVTVNVAVSDQFFGWVFGLGDLVRIVAPVHVKQGMKEMLEKVHEGYN